VFESEEIVRLLRSTVVQDISGYRYTNSELNGSHSYLLPAVLEILSNTSQLVRDKSLFDLGCGNGSVTHAIAKRGFRVAGVDTATEGIAFAKERYPNLDLRIGSAYDDLRSDFGTFSYVLSLEVVEHLYSPKIFASTVYSLLGDGGYAIISTPYHGYLKNLALAITNGFDRHFTAMWDHGHIKFWSVSTLGHLLEEAGFKSIRFVRVGRIPPLAKSMIAVARK
jgi:2-polyprenyl-3-methyl-5-hydroxy-6-metoxy-1,4-benzoquinol methylase